MFKVNVLTMDGMDETLVEVNVKSSGTTKDLKDVLKCMQLLIKAKERFT